MKNPPGKKCGTPGFVEHLLASASVLFISFIIVVLKNVVATKFAETTF